MVGAIGGNLGNLMGKSSASLKVNLSAAFETVDFKAVSGPGANSKGKMDSRINIVRQALNAA